MLDVTRFVRKLAIVSAAVTFTASCGAPQTTNTVGPQNDTKTEAPQTEDLVFKDYDTVTLTGVLFQPEAIQKPGMARVKIAGKPNLAKQRKAFETAKPDKKVVEAMTLVTMLWDESKNLPEDQGKAMRQEARDVLKTTRDTLGDGAGENILLMLFSAEMWVDNTEGAIETGNGLLAKYPDSDKAKAIAPFLASMYLRSLQTAEAAQLSAGWTIGDPQTDELESYVVAWVKFRQRDYQAARDAMVAAARNWKSKATWDAVERDLILMLTRSQTPIDQAATLFQELSKGDNNLQYRWLYQLFQGYEFAGYTALAMEALEKALGVLGDQVPAVDRFVFRYRQVSGYLTTHEPDKMADALLAAHAAAGPCGDPCAGKQDEIAGEIVKLAPFLHTTYTTTQDENYYGPAKKLYEFYLTLNRPDAETVRGYLSRLEETKQRAVPNSGKHDKDILLVSTNLRSQEIKACYEGVLQTETKLTGTITLQVEIDDNGTVSGASSEPAPGQEGLAAVASCAIERAKTWKFPARTKKGKTAVIRAYALQPAAAQQPAAPQQPQQ